MGINEIIEKVIDTLRYYESDFTSVKRTPVDYQERSKSLSHFIECRFNFELFKMARLVELAQKTDGHLFKVIDIVGENSESFEKVTLIVNDDMDIWKSEDTYSKSIEIVINALGGNKITFLPKLNDEEIKVIIEKV